MPLCSTPIRSRWNGQRIYSCFLVQFLVLYFRFSRAKSGALLSIFSCSFSCSTFDFLVQFLVLYFRFSRAKSGALLSIFSCCFSCSTFDFLVQFLVPYFRFSRAISGATVTEISRQKKWNIKKEQKNCASLYLAVSKQIKTSWNYYISFCLRPILQQCIVCVMWWPVHVKLRTFLTLQGWYFWEKVPHFWPFFSCNFWWCISWSLLQSIGGHQLISIYTLVNYII